MSLLSVSSRVPNVCVCAWTWPGQCEFSFKHCMGQWSNIYVRCTCVIKWQTKYQQQHIQCVLNRLLRVNWVFDKFLSIQCGSNSSSSSRSTNIRTTWNYLRDRFNNSNNAYNAFQWALYCRMLCIASKIYYVIVWFLLWFLYFNSEFRIIFRKLFDLRWASI